MKHAKSIDSGWQCKNRRTPFPDKKNPCFCVENLTCGLLILPSSQGYPNNTDIGA